MAEKKKGLFSKKPAEMKPTPRKQLPGYLADALINARNFADRARVPESVPLIGGQGLGSLFLGQAPEEVNELSYGNSPIQMNPYAGRTGSYVPEMKRGRGAQVFDALSLLSLPGARTVAGGLFGGGLTPGVDAAATVYHGSPFKFDRFDSSKIGTGEGAQAYGHGLYLADSPDVARYYKSAGTDASMFVPVRSIRDPAQMAATALERAGGDMRHAQAVLAQNAQSGDITAGAALQLLKQRAALPESKYAGNLYKVDLPDDAIAKMLDFDKSLSQQPAAAKHFKEMHELNGGQGYINSNGTYTALGVGSTDELTGKDLVNFLVKMGGGQTDASAILRQQGIPGIRYLDGGSRGAGQGTSNYVVFPGNESLLTILERNGQVVNPIYRDPFGNTLDETIR